MNNYPNQPSYQPNNQPYPQQPYQPNPAQQPYPPQRPGQFGQPSYQPYPQQQPYQPTQQPYPNNPMPNQPPGRQPRKRRRWWIWVLVAIGFMVVVGSCNAIISGGKGVGNTDAATPTNAPTQASSQATNAPTIAPTQKPTQAAPTITPTLASSSGPALLGSDIGTFNTTFGSPNNHSISGQYHYQTYPGENTDSLIVSTDQADGGSYTNRAYYITAQAPASGWTSTNANAKCGAFFPRDAIHKRNVATQNGTDKIYFSQSLASLFPTSAFTDANQNQVTPGYFDVLFLAVGNNGIDSCSIIIGEQQTT